MGRLRSLRLALAIGLEPWGSAWAAAGRCRRSRSRPSSSCCNRTSRASRARRRSSRCSTIPPGGATPRHIHPDGHEIVYVLEGATTAEIDGRETRSYGVGEVVHVPPNVPHVGRNASKTEPLKVLIIRIKDKSKPVMVPVK